MRTIIAILVISVVFLNACQPDSSREDTEVFSSNFVWKGDSLGNSYFDHSAIIIPVEPEKVCTRKTYLQLQSGINQHYIYEDFIDSFPVQNTELNEPELTFSGEIGTYRFDSIQMPLVFRQYSVADSVIGCVGFDFFETKQVLLDFKNQRIEFADEFDTENRQAIPYKIYLEHKLLIPVSLNGKEVFFLCNPLSPLYVVFNQLNINEMKIGENTYATPNTQSIEDANPAFRGILGYAFFKDKRLIVDTESQSIYILD
ncbi:MAG: hypothetical protein PF448_00975 [Bacteroidales bacterium]|jgi:hypothetical protein|nr:hypothetical protein [Bacteroidales bacterium]